MEVGEVCNCLSFDKWTIMSTTGVSNLSSSSSSLHSSSSDGSAQSFGGWGIRGRRCWATWQGSRWQEHQYWWQCTKLILLELVFKKIAFLWRSERTPFLCHLLRMSTTTNGHLHEERTFKPWQTSLLLAKRHAVRFGAMKRKHCLEELELHSSMAFVHTMYGMLGIVPIDQSSGTTRKTINKWAMTLKPISALLVQSVGANATSSLWQNNGQMEVSVQRA